MRLAQRVFGEMPTVQPYLPPLFAPGPTLAGDAAPAWALEDTAVPLGMAVAAETRPAAVPRQPVPPAAVLPAPGLAATPVPALAEAAAVPEPPARRQALGEVLPPAPHEVIDETVLLAPEALPAPGVTARGTPLAAATAVSMPAPTPRATPPPAAPLVPALRRAQEDAAPAVAPRRESTSATQPEVPEAPSIRVTIGRIDVRAVLPPAPPVPPAPRPRPQSAAKMSLDDYLRARRGGRR